MELTDEQKTDLLISKMLAEQEEELPAQQLEVPATTSTYQELVAAQIEYDRQKQEKALRVQAEAAANLRTLQELQAQKESEAIQKSIKKGKVPVLVQSDKQSAPAKTEQLWDGLKSFVAKTKNKLETQMETVMNKIDGVEYTQKPQLPKQSS